MESEILYAADVARMVGKTQQAFTACMQRESSAVPPGRFKLGRLWAWRRSTVEAWLAGLESGELDPAPRRKPGRPRATPAAPQAMRG